MVKYRKFMWKKAKYVMLPKLLMYAAAAGLIAGLVVAILHHLVTVPIIVHAETFEKAASGAISLGHPIGCTGARIVVTLLHEMRRSGAQMGIATLCISGGMGMSMLLESE